MKPETIDVLAEIHDFVANINKKEGNSLTFQQEINIANSLACFVESATLKFIAGQKEHGGLLEDRNLQEERSKEILDFFWYNEAELWKKNKI